MTNIIEFLRQINAHAIIKGLIVFCCLCALAFLLWDCVEISHGEGQILKDIPHTLQVFANSLAFFSVSIILGLVEATTAAVENGYMHYVVLVAVGSGGVLAMICAAFIAPGELKNNVFQAGLTAFSSASGFFGGVTLEQKYFTGRPKGQVKGKGKGKART